MAQLLSLSRAARLVGVSRGALQQQMKDGDMPTFEGKIAVTDLLQLYPNVCLEQDRELDRVTKIKDAAFARRIRERVMPDAEVLAVRIQQLGHELARSQALTDHFRGVLESVRAELMAISPPGSLVALLARIDGELTQPRVAEVDEGLLAQDSILRIMTAHVRTQPAGHEYFVEGADSLLEAGLRSGLALPYGCSDGRCGQCKARLLSGKIKPIRAAGDVLSEAEHRDRQFLLCSCTAITDVVIEAAEASSPRDMPEQQVRAVIKSVAFPTPDMALVHAQTPPQRRLRFLAGQSFRLVLPSGYQAQLSCAGCPCDDRNLYFHVGAGADPFSRAVFNPLREGAQINIVGPFGHFALDPQSIRPILFLAYDGGFAPIKAMIDHAMALDNAPSMRLVWLASHKDGHYLHNLCRSWADALDNFAYTPRMVTAGKAALTQVVAEVVAEYPALPDFDIYAAGPPDFIAVVEEVCATRTFPHAQLHYGVINT